jgi:predicted transcriptional regulator YdeE
MNEPLVTVRPDCDLDPFTLAGLSIRTDNAEAARSIPALWQRVMAEDLLRTIPGAIPLAPASGDEIPLVALYDDYESDHRGPYTLTVGVPVRSGAGLDPKLAIRAVARSRYAHVEAGGPPGPAVWNAWAWVWRELTPRRAFTADFELYLPSRIASGPIDLFLASKG